MWDVILLRAIFSSTYSLGKAGLASVQPFFFVGSRMMVCGIILLAVEGFKKKSFYIARKDVYFFVQIALFHVYITYATEFWALQYLPSTTSALIYTGTPFVTAFFAWIFLEESLQIKKCIGLFIGLLGLLFLLFFQKLEASEIYASTMPWPEIVIFFGMIGYSYGWIAIKRVAHDYSPYLINGVTMFAGGTLALVTSFFLDTWHQGPIIAFRPYLMYLVLLVITTIFGNNFSVILLRKYSVTLLTFAGFLDPLMVALLSWFMLGEQVSWHFFASLGVLFIGLYLFYREELQSAPVLINT